MTAFRTWWFGLGTGVLVWAAVATRTPPADGIGAFHRQPADRPAMDAGHGRFPLLVMDPNVHVDADGYHLFFSSYFYRKDDHWLHAWDRDHDGAVALTDTITAIGYAHSIDRGLTWQLRETPVFVPGPDQRWDSNRVETASVTRLGDRLLLFYSADAKGARQGRYQIGCTELALHGRTIHAALMDPAVSFDGQRRARPLLAAITDHTAFRNNIQEPSVVVDGARLLLYFVGIAFADSLAAADAPGQTIRQVGVGRAILDQDLHVTAISDTPQVSGGAIIEVRKFGGLYHLFATTPGDGPVHGGERLERYVSTDGEHWGKPVPILQNGPQPPHDNWAMLSPTVAVEESQLVLFYSAIGWQPGACFPVPSGGRWGIPIPGNRCLHVTLGRAEASWSPAR